MQYPQQDTFRAAIALKMESPVNSTPKELAAYIRQSTAKISALRPHHLRNPSKIRPPKFPPATHELPSPQLHAAHPPQWVSVHRKSSLHPPLPVTKPTSPLYQTSSYQLPSPTNANNISPAAPSSPTTQTTQPGPATPPASATGSSPRKAGPPAARSAPPPRRTHRTTRPPAHRTSACC